MRKVCRVTINDQVFSAFRGDLLLEAAHREGVDIPHDCNSGDCGMCRIRVLDGLAIGGEGRRPGTVLACETRIMSDLDLRIDTLPRVQTVSGEISAIRRRGCDVVEVKIEPTDPLMYLPGQFLRVQFRGYPSRCYNPTVPMDDEFPELDDLHLQVRQWDGGRVSPTIGSEIRVGHKVRMKGPFGSAFLRPRSESRLVLVCASTGFAPVWSIAVAAVRENPDREIVLVAGARSLKSLYMVNALCMLARFPKVTIVPVVETPQRVPDVIRVGGVTDHIPQLSAQDSVHVCGPLALVTAVTHIAAEAGAPCYCVPFQSRSGEREALEGGQARAVGRAPEWRGGGQQRARAS